MVRGGALDGAARGWDEGLNGRGVVCAGEGLGLGLGAPDDRQREQLLVDAAVEVQDVEHLLLGGGLLGKGGVALLPEELPRAQEGRRLLDLPPHDAAPLVQLHRQVSVRLDPAGVCGVHGRLTRRPDRDGLLQVGVAELRHHGQLRRKVVEVVRLLLHVALGDEHGEVAVLDAELLDLAVEPALHQLPDPVGPRAQDEAALHGVLLDELRLLQHLLVPAGHIVQLADAHAATLGLLHSERSLPALLRLLLLPLRLLRLLLRLWRFLLRLWRFRSLCGRRRRRGTGLSLQCLKLLNEPLDALVLVDLLAAQALRLELLLEQADFVADLLDLRFHVGRDGGCCRGGRRARLWGRRTCALRRLGRRRRRLRRRAGQLACLLDDELVGVLRLELGQLLDDVGKRLVYFVSPEVLQVVIAQGLSRGREQANADEM
mmetsp:Transcript_86091/g.251888  ORF Transcript_86091/g.251888 Transcript_86091/m.251888 type:complete len:430 (+) Transcript_86091:1041-2330(+)